MVNGEHLEWKIDQAKFQGYMKANIEDIKKKLDDHREVHKDLYERTEKNSKDITKVRTKIGAIIAVSATVVSSVVSFIWHFGRKMFGAE